MTQIDPDKYYVAQFNTATSDYTIIHELGSFEEAAAKVKDLGINQKNIISGLRLIEMGMTEY